MDLDPGLGLRLAVGVPADVMPAVDDEHAQAQIARAPLRDGEPEKPGPDDDEVGVHAFADSRRAAAEDDSWSHSCPRRLPSSATSGRYTARRNHHGMRR